MLVGHSTMLVAKEIFIATIMIIVYYIHALSIDVSCRTSNIIFHCNNWIINTLPMPCERKIHLTRKFIY